MTCCAIATPILGNGMKLPQLSLRTLLIVAMLAGPALAGAWWGGSAVWREFRILYAWEVEGRTYPAAVEYIDKGK